MIAVLAMAAFVPYLLACTNSESLSNADGGNNAADEATPPKEETATKLEANQSLYASPADQWHHHVHS
jgi:hypothetical protein